jgi:hypothetical protein
MSNPLATPVESPQAILDRLDADQITARLLELERERRALMVLLRAAKARQKRLLGREGAHEK